MINRCSKCTLVTYGNCSAEERQERPASRSGFVVVPGKDCPYTVIEKLKATIKELSMTKKKKKNPFTVK